MSRLRPGQMGSGIPPRQIMRSDAVSRNAAPLPVHAIHASGRFDRQIAEQQSAMRGFAARASIVTHTEQAGRAAERIDLFRRAGWSYYRPDDAPGTDECVVAWDSDAWRLDGDPTVAVTTKEFYYRTSGAKTPPFWLLAVPLAFAPNPAKRIVVITTHMPTRSTPRRREVWASAMSGLVSHVRDERAEDSAAAILVAADWNMDYRATYGRALLTRSLGGAGLVSCWPAGDLPKQGTHGSAIIDGSWTTAHPRGCELLPLTPASDHRAYLTTVEI